MSYLYLFFICMLSGAGRIEPSSAEQTFHASECLGCGYSLAGRRPQDVCPECGRQGAGVGVHASRPMLVIREDCKARCARWSWLFGLLCIASELAAPYVVAISYRVQGFPWSTGVRVAKLRELGSGYYSDYWSAGLPGFPGMRALSGVIVAFAVTPVLWRISSPRRRMVLTMLIISIGVVYTLWRWTIPYLSPGPY